MADMSIIEFVVYGFICYTGMLMLIISTIKTEIPTTRSLAIIRAIYLIPSAICALIIASSGVDVLTSDTTNTIIALNTTEVFTEQIQQNVTLQNPMWQAFHVMLFLVMMIFVVSQIMNLLTKTD